MSLLWSQFKNLIFIGWAIAFIRLGLDAFAPSVSMLFGVYYGMLVVIFIYAIQGVFKGTSWIRLAGGMILVGVLVWGLPNAISYTIAQFQGWDHGRFAPGRGPEIAETSGGKILTGLAIGGATSIAGSIWCIFWATLIIWLVGKFRKEDLEREAEETDTAESSETKASVR